MDFSICAVKLDFECVEKANLSNNAAKALWRKIKRKDSMDGKECIINAYLNVGNVFYCAACYPTQINLFEPGEIKIKQVREFAIKPTKVSS